MPLNSRLRDRQPPRDLRVAHRLCSQRQHGPLPLRNSRHCLGHRHNRHLRDDRPGPADFINQTRDLYVSPGDIGFWQGAFRDQGSPDYKAARQAVIDAEALTVDLLYGDQEGGQRVITRFVLRPGQEGVWISSSTHHWNVDRPDPR
jgi:hypothetical protein